MKYELWEEDEGEQTFCIEGSGGDSARRLLGASAKLVWSCEAESHSEAMTKYYIYMGWGKYKGER